MDQLRDLKKRRVEVKKAIDDLSFEKEKNKNDLDERYKELKELDSQIAGFEEKFEKQKKRASLSSTVYRSLQSVLNRSNEFYPNNELFDEDLVYFPEKELQAMRDMQVCLTSGNEERMFLLYGNPASGKTVMGIAVGKGMEKQGYDILYHKITDESDIDELWPEIRGCGEKDVLFILDDCHLNIETVSRLYTRFESIPHAACLLISRYLPKNLRFTDEYLPDIFEKLEDRSYRMDVARDNQVEDKMCGIVEKRKAYYVRKENKEFIVGDVQRVIKNVGRNYLTLYFYLSFWTASQPLDRLDENKVLQKVYSRYLDIKANKPHRDIFLKYAALYRYEIQFRPAPGDEGSIEALLGQGLLEYNSDSELYRFYHSDFAKLLLKSYSSRPAFKEMHTSLEEFTTAQLKAYITGFRNYPPNLTELYKNLVVNAGIPVFKALLKDAEVRNKTIALYQNINPLYQLSNFLSQVEYYANDEFEAFLEGLIFNNPSIKNLFLSGKETFPPFWKILIMLKNNHPRHYSTFLEMFNPDELELILLNTSLHIVGQSLNILGKSDMITARSFLNALNVNELLKKAYQLKFHYLGHALIELNNVNPGKAKEIFGQIEPGVLLDKAQEVDFKRFGNALCDLEKVDIEKCGEILRGINPRKLVQKAQQEKYNVFLQSIPAFARIDAVVTKQLLTRLPEEFLFQFDFLLNSQNFNRLLYTIHLSGPREYAMKLIDFAKENLDTLMKSPLKEVANFFSLCSEYIDVKPIISKYSSKFFGKMRYGEPLHIPFFLRIIHGIHRNTALEYLHYLEKLGLKEPLGSCYYEIGNALAEKKDITGSINYLKKALPLLEEYENKNCLALTYFLLAKNEETLNHREKARTSANKALLNAGELPGLEKEIEGFIIQINKN